MSAPDSIFVRACKGLPTPATPVWFMRQAGRYMSEYRAVRQNHSLIEICKRPPLAAEVTITAAEKLGVDAAIIFADLLLPLEAMGVPFYFSSGEGPVIESPVRDVRAIRALKTNGVDGLGYVSEAIALCVKHWGAKMPVIGFCGAPFTLASYMVEGGGSRNYIEIKRLMHTEPQLFDELLGKLTTVLGEYGLRQAAAGADVLQVFDSWVGCLSPEDYKRFVLPRTAELIAKLKSSGVPVIYFGTASTALLPMMAESGADVIGLDWRVSLAEGWRAVGNKAVQGNLDPALLFAGRGQIEQAAGEILRQAGGRAGHIFNLGHGILPGTPVEDVKALADFVHERSSKVRAGGESS
jgi:uroporphyrinogen decarboxylase